MHPATAIAVLISAQLSIGAQPLELVIEPVFPVSDSCVPVKFHAYIRNGSDSPLAIVLPGHSPSGLISLPEFQWSVIDTDDLSSTHRPGRSVGNRCPIPDVAQAVDSLDPPPADQRHEVYLLEAGSTLDLVSIREVWRTPRIGPNGQFRFVLYYGPVSFDSNPEESYDATSKQLTSLDHLQTTSLESNEVTVQASP